MNAKKTSWFHKLLATFCMFGAMFMWLGISTGHSTNMRQVDASLGLLHRPMTSSVKDAYDWAEKLMFKGVKVEALFLENISEIVSEVAIKLLNAALKSFVGFLENIFNRLEQAFDSLIKAGKALVDNAAQYADSLGLWSLGKSMSTVPSEAVAKQITPAGASAAVMKAATDAVSAIRLKSMINYARKGQNTASPTPTDAEIQKDVNEVSAATTATCGNTEIWGFSDLSFQNRGCAVTQGAANTNAIGQQLSKDAADYDKAQEVRDRVAPKNCQFGFMDFKNQDLFAGTITSIQPTTDFTNAGNYSVGLTTMANNMEPQNLTPDECDKLTRGSTENFFASIAPRPAPTNGQFDFDGVISSLRDMITKFANNIIDKITKVIIAPINQFIGNFSFTSNSITQLLNKSTAALPGVLSEIKKQLG
jgi:hypothetical protein